MNAAQVQVAAAALAPERRPVRNQIQPGQKVRPGAIKSRPQPRIPRAVLEKIAEKQ